MARKARKGMSQIIELSILVLVVAVAALFVGTRLMGSAAGPDQLTVFAAKQSATVTGTAQYATISVKLSPKGDAPLTIQSLQVTVHFANGTAVTKTINVANGAFGSATISNGAGTVTINVAGTPNLTPGKTTELTISITNTDTANLVNAVEVSLTVADATGATFSKATGVVTLT